MASFPELQFDTRFDGMHHTNPPRFSSLQVQSTEDKEKFL